MKKMLFLIIISATFFGLTITSLCLLPNNAKGEVITDPSQLRPHPNIIDFEQFTAGYPTTPITNPLVIGDVTFSTEASLYIRDITRYPSNGTEVEGNVLDTEPDNLPMTITFSRPLNEVLLGWWDPNYPGNFLRAYNKDNVLLEEVEITDLGPPHGLWATWIGFRRNSHDIWKLEVVPSQTGPDNYSVDNIMYRTIPVPEPSLIVLLGISIASVVGLRRRWKE